MSNAVRENWSAVSTAIGDLKSDRIVAVLEQQILSGELAAGTLLPPEQELSALLGVSRTVLRDAVRALVARGLLDVRQGRGTLVAHPNDEAYADAMVALLARSALTVHDVMETRIALERMVVRLAASAGTPDDWEALAAIERALVEAIHRGDDATAHDRHAAFHRGILAATHQQALILMLSPLNKVALLTGTTSVRPGETQDWDIDAHRIILDALTAGDADAAERAMCTHFSNLDSLPAYRAERDRPFAQALFAHPLAEHLPNPLP